jgi:hypothetical protein
LGRTQHREIKNKNMSYRNPRVIVDRSGEIWGQAIAGFGKDIARGIDAYSAIKQKNQELERKQTETKQLMANGVSQKFSENIEKISSNIKDSSISKQFKDTARMMADTGESVNINGKSVTIGAIEAQTELKVNPNLDKETRNAYSKIVTDFKSYQSTMVSSAGNIISGLEGLSKSSTGMIGKMFDYQGEGIENTKSQIAAYSLLNKKMKDITSAKALTREKGEDGVTRNMLTINSDIDTNSKTYKDLLAAKLISPEDLVFEKGSTIGRLSWKRDLATWGEEGELIVPIAPEGDTTESMRIAGFTDEKGNATGKGFNNNSLYTRRRVKGGIESKSEQHFDPDALRYDPAYEAELKGSAEGILALPLDQQVKYITNTLGWSTIKQAEWANATPEEHKSFLMEQRFEKDLQKIMGAGGKNRVQTRDATQDDVNAYKNDGIDISLTNEDDSPTKLYYTTTGTSITADKTKSTKGSQGKGLYDKVRKDPVGFYQERTGIKPKYETNSKGDKIIIIPAETEENAQGEIIETMPKEAFNMSDKTQRKTFYNYLLKLSKMGEGNSEDSKKIRTQFEDALSQGTAKKLNNDASERARLMKKYFPNKK